MKCKAIQIKNLRFEYPGNPEFCIRVDDFSENIAPVTGVYGLAGSGKSSLARLMCQLEKPVSGDIVILGENNNLVENPEILYTMQFPENTFLGVTLQSTVDKIAGFRDGSDLENRLAAILNDFGVSWNSIRQASGFEISSGELRRFALALNFACQPDILVLDEPTIALGKTGTRQLVEIIRRESESTKIFLITHDFRLIEQVTEKLWVIDKGEIVFRGKISEIMALKNLAETIGLAYFENRKNG